jgi:hypothetical protein
VTERWIAALLSRSGYVVTDCVPHLAAGWFDVWLKHRPKPINLGAVARKFNRAGIRFVGYGYHGAERGIVLYVKPA